MDIDALYSIYVTIYGTVISGTKLTASDYYHQDFMQGATPFTQQERLAVSMASQDVVLKQAMKNKTAFEQKLKELLG